MDTVIRNIRHLYKSGCITIGIEHFLVMFPSALLIAKYADIDNDAIISLQMILFSCGLMTILFSMIKVPKVPFFLGPSISYIGFLSFYVGMADGDVSHEEIRATILCGYLLAGVLLFVLSLAYRHHRFREFINVLFPYTVMGPAISLIGLQVVDNAVADAGLNGNDNMAILISMLTLCIIIIVSLTGVRFLQNASVLFGVIVGCIFSVLFGKMDFSNIIIPHRVVQFTFWDYWDKLQLPSERMIILLLSILPPTIIVFMELHGRMLIFEGMLKRDDIALEKFEIKGGYGEFRGNVLFKHALLFITSCLCGITPCTIYAQNIAVMNLHNTDLSHSEQAFDDSSQFVKNCYDPYSLYPYRVAGLISIFVSFFTYTQNLLKLIPIPVFGGMELFLFGLIAAPGIQVLVEEQVNYKKSQTKL